jgi:hypothetical protein
VTELDSYPRSRVTNSQPAGIGRVADLGDICAWNNLGRNVVFASRDFEPCAVFDQTQFPDNDELSQYDLDVHAILDVPTAGVVVMLNHLGLLRAFRRSEIRTPRAIRRLEPVWTRIFADDMERVVALGDRLIGSRPREQHAGGLLVSEPVAVTADGARLGARLELEAWGTVTALGTVHTGRQDCVAVGGNGRVALVPIDRGAVGPPRWEVGVDFEPAAFAFDGRHLWVAGPELGAAGIDDYEWKKLRGGGFAALDLTNGNSVVRSRFAHDLAWGNGGTAVVIAAGLVCGIGRAGEVDVYSTADGDPRTCTAAFAGKSLGIAHAAVVGDRILYGFNRGGYRLHTVALSALASSRSATARIASGSHTERSASYRRERPR